MNSRQKFELKLKLKLFFCRKELKNRLTLVFLKKLGYLCFSENEVAEGSSNFFVVEDIVDVFDGFEERHLDLELSLESPVLWKRLTSFEALLLLLFFELALPIGCLF